MPIIKPISALRNKSKEISKLVHESREPVFITKNGEGDMVLMSMQEYNRLIDGAHYGKLLEAERDIKFGVKPIPAKKVFEKLRKKHFGKSKN